MSSAKNLRNKLFSASAKQEQKLKEQSAESKAPALPPLSTNADSPAGSAAPTPVLTKQPQGSALGLQLSDPRPPRGQANTSGDGSGAQTPIATVADAATPVQHPVQGVTRDPLVAAVEASAVASSAAPQAATGSATTTPADAAPALRINIPGSQPAPPKKEQLPKSRVPVVDDRDKTPPANESLRTPRTEDSETPGYGTRGRQLRERLMESLGSRYRSVENYRLEQSDAYTRHWKRWGPYLSERQWGTVREDYSANGDAWNSFPFSMSKSRAYRWGEDGIAGISDNHQRLCFSLAMWNGKDEILKERLYGLTGEQGNHGEDVKEMYYYLDSSPTHSYMKYLYKYPQAAYPYQELLDKNRQRSRDEMEYEIMDTGLFDNDRYWDVFIEFAKDEEDENSISIRVTAYNRGPDAADLHLLPQLWFRNTWSWPSELPKDMPEIKEVAEGVMEASHPTLGITRLYCTPSPAPAAPTKGGVVLVDGPSVVPELLFTNNETNFERLYGGENRTPYVKDAFHDYVIPSHRPPMPQPERTKPVQTQTECDTEASTTKPDAAANGMTAQLESATIDNEPVEPEVWPAEKFVNPNRTGTKAASHYLFNKVPGRGGCVVIRLKLTPNAPSEDPAILDEELFDENIEDRRQDTDEFYSLLGRGSLGDDLRNIMRQALSGMLWTKQYYQFIQKEWMDGDPSQPPPPPERKFGRNKEWRHMYINDILSMPDKWEYPWFATWDTAFHCIPLAMIDPGFAKKQLDLMTREWYMKPDGALPAYEWNFSDVNPPVHAWATFRVFKIERKMFGREDLDFLERVFQKLLLNFTWWVNRKDSDGNNVFEGGFLGLDNIGPFNRSEPLPTGGTLRQADGTAWMAFFCLNMLSIALELAKHNPTYEDIASKFFEHFLYISDAMSYTASNDQNLSMWDEEDGFYHDLIQWGYGNAQKLRVFSMVGLMPLYGVLVLEPQQLKRFPSFKKRLDWFVANRPDIAGRNIASLKARGKGDRLLLSLCSQERLERILERMFDEDQFFSDFGIRSLSKYHKDKPFHMNVNGQSFDVPYWPGDSHSALFGGNSNWRGPVWLAVNLLLIESLQRFHQYYSSDFVVECPVGSGTYMNMAGCAEEIQHRIIHIFSRDENDCRAVNGGSEKLNHNAHFRDYIHFYEYFHGDNGRGIGASHQTGWTGIVAWLIHQTGEFCRLPKTPRTPRSVAHAYFGDVHTPIPATPSEAGDTDSAPYSAYTTVSEWEEPEPDEL